LTQADLENRHHHRCPVKLPVRLATIDPDRDTATGELHFLEVDGSSLNLSRGGTFVSTASGPPPGRRVLVEVHLPNDQTVQALGRVAWKTTRVLRSRPTGSSDVQGIGIEFLGGRPDQLCQLERYLARRAELRG